MSDLLKSLLSVRSVVRLYGAGCTAVSALAGVSLELQAGEFTALVGPSGSGKTTLLNLVGALDRPDRGELLIDGHDLSRLSRTQRSALRLHKLGFVFQSYNLMPVLSALENVEYVLQLQGRPAAQRRQRAQAMLEAVGLSSHMHRRPDELSGGQQQRVAVARALVGEPLLVLADEPTANLDSDTGESLLQTMQKLNRDLGTTFLFSTHDPMVMRYARRVVRMKDGVIMEDSADDVAEALRA
jgi:putative ABC transport system ATP-binding protein